MSKIIPNRAKKPAAVETTPLVPNCANKSPPAFEATPLVPNCPNKSPPAIEATSKVCETCFSGLDTKTEIL